MGEFNEELGSAVDPKRLEGLRELTVEERPTDNKEYAKQFEEKGPSLSEKFKGFIEGLKKKKPEEQLTEIATKAVPEARLDQETPSISVSEVKQPEVEADVNNEETAETEPGVDIDQETIKALEKYLTQVMDKVGLPDQGKTAEILERFQLKNNIEPVLYRPVHKLGSNAEQTGDTRNDIVRIKIPLENITSNLLEAIKKRKGELPRDFSNTDTTSKDFPVVGVDLKNRSLDIQSAGNLFGLENQSSTVLIDPLPQDDKLTDVSIYVNRETFSAIAESARAAVPPRGLGNNS